MKQMSLGAVIAFAASIVAVSASQQPPTVAGSPAAAGEKTVTITGCVVKGDDGGFLLAHALNTTAATTPAGTTAEAVATAPRPSQVLYWLEDDDNELDGYSGQKVEITGELEGEIEKTDVEFEREGEIVKLEVKSDGKKVKARLPHVPAAVGTSGAASDRDIEPEFIVRKLDVKSVKLIGESCD